MAQIRITRNFMDTASELFDKFKNMSEEEVQKAYKVLPRSKRRKLLAIHKKLKKSNHNTKSNGITRETDANGDTEESS